jgi:hypothetical protein
MSKRFTVRKEGGLYCVHDGAGRERDVTFACPRLARALANEKNRFAKKVRRKAMAKKKRKKKSMMSPAERRAKARLMKLLRGGRA